MAFKPSNDKDCCTGCGECVEICPVGVWEIVDDKSEAVNADECVRHHKIHPGYYAQRCGCGW